MNEPRPRRLGALLFPGFELLDLFGPLEMFGNLPGVVEVAMVAERAGAVASAQGPAALAQYGYADCPGLDLLLVPGGIGTRSEIDNRTTIDWLSERAPAAEVTMTVCTGAALLAQTGLLDGRRATSNKMLFQWVETQWPRVQWIRQARWVEDGGLVTSSGVSAGMDMALAVIARIAGQPTSETLSVLTEYEWHRDAAWDPFAAVHGLV